MTDSYFRRDRVALTAAGVRAIVDAAVAKAQEMGVPQCIAVVDDGGHLLAFHRMDAARLASITIAQTKAVSAARRKRPTVADGNADPILGLRLALASGGQFTNIGGGVPIVVDEQTIGAIGVSSGTSEEDMVVAAAGLAALGL
jgi:glc operon protein GlcG